MNMYEQQMLPETFMEYHDLVEFKLRKEWSRTPLGFVGHYSGYFFCGYSVYRVLMTAFNIALGRENKIDPVTRGDTICEHCRVSISNTSITNSRAVSRSSGNVDVAHLSALIGACFSRELRCM